MTDAHRPSSLSRTPISFSLNPMLQSSILLSRMMAKQKKKKEKKKKNFKIIYTVDIISYNETSLVIEIKFNPC